MEFAAKVEETEVKEEEKKEEVVKPVVTATENENSSTEAKVAEVVPEIVDQMAAMTVHGNKSLIELRDIQSKSSHLSAGILFTDPALKIPRPILESITQELRFEKPSQIQASTLPLILDGKNIIAQAQSGAGKTLAFVVGMLAAIDINRPVVQAICLAPTREIVIGIVRDTIFPLSSRMTGICVEDALQGKETARGSVTNSHIIVGTPGTMKRLISFHYLPLNAIRIFVLDEADKMVEEKALGADTLWIRQKLPPQGTQILMFSATYTPEIISYAKRINPGAYVVTPRSKEELVLDVIFQVKMDVNKSPGGKLQVLKDIYDFMTLQQSIVFVEMKREADKVAQMMQAAGFEVSFLHGELQGTERDRVMDNFRAGRTKVLITTNVLARGVDIPAVAVVVNYDLPVRRSNAGKIVADESTYLHRIGRCGRFGRRGTAINFLEKPDDFHIIETIEKFYVQEGKTMVHDWDPNKIEELTDAIKSRPAGGEIQLEALDGNAAATPVAVSILT